MKLFKKLISSLAAVAICSSLVPSSLAAVPEIIVNETFDGYATNVDTIKNVSLRGGVDSRVVDEGLSGKAFYSKLWGTSLVYDANASAKGNSVVVGASFKLDGAATMGTLLAVKDVAGSLFELVKVNGGALSTYDGKKIASVKPGKWFKLDVVIDFSKRYADIYYNGGLCLEHWYLTGKISNVATVEIKMLAPEDTTTYTDFYVDNLRVYTASEPAPDNVFPKTPINNKKIAFTPTEDLSDVIGWVITDERFYSSSAIAIVNDGNTVKIVKEENGNSYLLMQRVDNLTNAYVDFNVGSEDAEKLLGARAFTMSADVRYDKLSGGLDVLDIRRDDASWYTTGRLDPTGAFAVRGKASGIIGAKEWHKVSYVFNNTTARMSVYVDGKLTATDLSFDPNIPPQRIRFGMQLNGDTDNTIGIDNFRLYEGDDVNKVFEEEEVEIDLSDEGGFLGESDKDAINLFSKGDVAFVLEVGSVFRNGAKCYPENAPYAKLGVNGVAATTVYDGSDILLPISFLKETFSADIKVEGNTITVNNGVVFTVGSTTYTANGKEKTAKMAPEAYGDEYALPLEATVIDALEKKLYVEPRGIVFVTDKNFTLRDSAGVERVYDKIDVIARYMYFKRPSAEELKNDLVSNIGNAHPRVFATSAQYDAIRKKVEADENCRKWANEVIHKADSYINMELPKYERLTNNDAPHILHLSRAMVNYMSDLTMAYQLTGDKKYVPVAYNLMVNACSYPDWCDDTHYLSTAEMMYGIAAGYDGFYNELTQQQRETIREGFIKNGFDPSYGCYNATHGNNYWVNGDDNFTSVCPGGIMAGCVAFYDDPVIGERATELICQNLKSFEYVMTLLYPDGAWYESVTYFTYVMQYMAAGFGALFNANGGKQYNMFSFPGASNVGKSVIGIQGNVDGAFNYHDGGKGYQTYPEYLWLAHLVGDNQFAQAQTKLGLTYGFSEASRLLLWYDPNDNVGDVEYPLDVYMREANTGSMRQNWTRSGVWVATHGGKTGIDHDALDIGEFIFEADGLRWIYDNGADNYSLPGYFSRAGYNIYRKRPEANNCIMINPRDGYTGQSVSSNNPLTRFESSERGSIMVYDMSEAYSQDASKAIRGFMLGDDRRSFVVRDELEMDGENTVYWFANILGDAKVVGNKVISVCDGKELQVEFASNAKMEISLVPQSPLESSPIVEGQADDSSKTKIQVILKGKGNMNITAKLVPGSYCYDNLPSASTIKAIDTWSIPAGSIPVQPKLTGITVNGSPIDGFDPNATSYLVNQDLDNPVLPVFGATAEDGATATVTQPANNQDKAVIEVVGADGGINHYFVSFHLMVGVASPSEYTQLPISAYNANEETQAENPKSAAVDNDTNSAYANSIAGGWFEVDLGQVTKFDGIEMAFRFGDQRYARFDIFVSDDGKNYTQIGSRFESSGTTDQPEVYKIVGKGRFVRIVNYGNSQDSPWLSLSEYHPVVKFE